jgi:ribosomal protein L24E
MKYVSLDISNGYQPFSKTILYLLTKVYLQFLCVYFRIGLCAYSGYKIYPGHGKTMVKTDGKVSTSSTCFYSVHCISQNILMNTVFFVRHSLS